MADYLTQLIRAARGAEAGGYYGVAKLLWAMAYSEEVKGSNQAGIPRGAELDGELSAIIESLKARSGDTSVITALEKGLQAVREDCTVNYTDVPGVYVSRTTGEVILGEPPEFTSNHDHRLGLREFKPIWYFEPMSPAECLNALEHNPDVIAEQISGLTTEQLLVAPAPGEWNMRELLWHLLQAQELVAARVEKMLTENHPSLEGMAVWAMKDDQAMSPADILERYCASREVMISRLKAIAPADWYRGGWHSEFGEQTVLSQATYFARHEMSHMPQFAQIRRAVAGV